MTVRGGIADILQVLARRQMLFSTAPACTTSRPPVSCSRVRSRPLGVRFEKVDIPTYNSERMAEAGSEDDFKHAVVRDLERRRATSTARVQGGWSTDRQEVASRNQPGERGSLAGWGRFLPLAFDSGQAHGLWPPRDDSQGMAPRRFPAVMKAPNRPWRPRNDRGRSGSGRERTLRRPWVGGSPRCCSWRHRGVGLDLRRGPGCGSSLGVLPFLALRFAIAAAATAALWAASARPALPSRRPRHRHLLAAGYLLQTFGLRLHHGHQRRPHHRPVRGRRAGRGPRPLPHPPAADRRGLAVAVSLVGMTLLTGRLPTSLGARRPPRSSAARSPSASTSPCCPATRRGTTRSPSAPPRCWPARSSFLRAVAGRGEVGLPPPEVWPALLVTGLVASALAYAIQTRRPASPVRGPDLASSCLRAAFRRPVRLPARGRPADPRPARRRGADPRRAAAGGAGAANGKVELQLTQRPVSRAHPGLEGCARAALLAAKGG